MATFLAGIRLKNYCGYKNTNFPFINQETGEIKKFCVIYGPNGIGKSSLLEAIRLIGNPFIYQGKNTELMFRKLTHHPDYDPTYTFIKEKVSPNRMRIDGVFDKDGEYKSITISNKGLVSSDLSEKPRGYVYNLDADNPMNMVKFQVLADQGDLFLNVAESIYGLKCEFTTSVEEKLKDIDGKDKKVNIYTGFIIEKKDGTRVHFKRMSAGEKKIATLISYLCDPLYMENIDIITVDNYSMHVFYTRHSFMVDKFIECFPNKQFIVTTHSETVIEHVRKNLGDDHLFDLSEIKYEK